MTKRRFMRFLHGMGLAYVVFHTVAGLSIIFAQDDPVLRYRVETNAQRIKELESLNMDRRMALVERAISESERNATFTGINMVGIAGLIGERLIQALRNKKTKDLPA